MNSVGLYLSDGREVTQQDLKRLLPTLGYFATHGRMPDPDLARKIREHPSSKEFKTQGRDFVVCHNCESLHHWVREPHDKCGHMLVPLEETVPDVLERILRQVVRDWRKKRVNEVLDARYPLRDSSPFEKVTLTCVNCEKTFQTKTNDIDRIMACSWECLYAACGLKWPEGRKWAGFITLYPTFRRGVVLYLGTSVHDRKKCECYLWRMKPQAEGVIYGYYGNGENQYLHEGHWTQNLEEHDELMKRADTAPDESWRIVANTTKGYFWKVPL